MGRRGGRRADSFQCGGFGGAESSGDLLNISYMMSLSPWLSLHPSSALLSRQTDRRTEQDSGAVELNVHVRGRWF